MRHPPNGAEHEGNANTLPFEVPDAPTIQHRSFRPAKGDERRSQRVGGIRVVADLSREEMEAKLEAAEARTEARFAQISGTIDVRFSNIENKLDRLTDVVNDSMAETKSTKVTVVVTTIGSVLAAIGIILAVLLTSQSNLLSAFQAGLAVKVFQSRPSASKP
jgi:hypothetical protein